LIVRATLLFAAVYAVISLVILGLVRRPDIPLLRYAVVAVPMLASSTLVACWFEIGAPWRALAYSKG
jgi:hypothetical protein